MFYTGKSGPAPQIPSSDGMRVEPEAGKDSALEIAGAIQGQSQILASLEDEPVHGLIVDSPDEVLEDAISAVDL